MTLYTCCLLAIFIIHSFRVVLCNFLVVYCILKIETGVLELYMA